MVDMLMECLSLMVLPVSICLLMHVGTVLIAHTHMLIVLVQSILEIILPVLCEMITIVNLEVLGIQQVAQFITPTHCGMVKDAVLVTVAVHRLACHGFNRDVLSKINEPIKARIYHDQVYSNEGILVKDLELYIQ